MNAVKPMILVILSAGGGISAQDGATNGTGGTGATGTPGATAAGGTAGTGAGPTDLATRSSIPLTKNATISEDFDLIERYRERVLVGLSITASPEKDGVMRVVEPNASSIKERMEVMREAHRRGLEKRPSAAVSRLGVLAAPRGTPSGSDG